MAEDMLFDEIGHSCSYHFLEPNSFHLLHIIFGDNKDPYVTILWRMDGANKIKPSGVERP